MTLRQKFLKLVYPAWMWLNKIIRRNTEVLKNKKVTPPISFYSLKAISGYGSLFDFSTLKGKKVMVVNTASDCGYSGQYSELQKLCHEHKHGLTILAFPSNDFGHQEQGSDDEIARFCINNYSVSFPVMSKSNVAPSPEQTPVYNWLTNAAFNGWNSKAPSWNFSKYLIDEQGKLIGYFGPSVSPLNSEIIEAIEKS